MEDQFLCEKHRKPMVSWAWWKMYNRCSCGGQDKTEEELEQEMLELRKQSDELTLLIEQQNAARRERKTREETGPGRWYFITFTQPDTDKSVAGLIKSTEKVIKSKMVSPMQWCYSIELTQSGTPHSHIRLFTEKYPEYKKVCAFNRGYISKCEMEKFNTANYVVKDETKPTPEQLAEWGLDSWFKCSDNYDGPKPMS